MFWPCETRTSTCRNFATISSGVYRFFGIAVLLHVKRHSSGRTTSKGEDQDGTWRLISSKRTTIATSATVDTFGPDPQGYIMYGRDGRMMVLMARSDRPKPESIEKITDEQRNRLFS